MIRLDVVSFNAAILVVVFGQSTGHGAQIQVCEIGNILPVTTAVPVGVVVVGLRVQRLRCCRVVVGQMRCGEWEPEGRRCGWSVPHPVRTGVLPRMCCFEWSWLLGTTPELRRG